MENHKKKYKLTIAILTIIIILMGFGIFQSCVKMPYTRTEVNLPFSLDSLTKLSGPDLVKYLGPPTSEFDSHKSWLVYINGQRYIILQDPDKIEILK